MVFISSRFVDELVIVVSSGRLIHAQPAGDSGWPTHFAHSLRAVDSPSSARNKFVPIFAKGCLHRRSSWSARRRRTLSTVFPVSWIVDDRLSTRLSLFQRCSSRFEVLLRHAEPEDSLDIGDGLGRLGRRNHVHSTSVRRRIDRLLSFHTRSYGWRAVIIVWCHRKQ